MTTKRVSWKAACPNSALKFSPASGTGSTTITIADAPAGQRTTLTVTAGEGSGAKTATCVIVRNPGDPVETVFSLDFGNGAGGVWAGANQEWKTQTGTGASTVTYAVNNVRINNDNYGSAGKYPGLRESLRQDVLQRVDGLFRDPGHLPACGADEYPRFRCDLPGG